jgi:hypothetical protein
MALACHKPLLAAPLHTPNPGTSCPPQRSNLSFDTETTSRPALPERDPNECRSNQILTQAVAALDDLDYEPIRKILAPLLSRHCLMQFWVEAIPDLAHLLHALLPHDLA